MSGITLPIGNSHANIFPTSYVSMTGIAIGTHGALSAAKRFINCVVLERSNSEPLTVRIKAEHPKIDMEMKLYSEKNCFLNKLVQERLPMIYTSNGISTYV
jgi:hypothetical protein